MKNKKIKFLINLIIICLCVLMLLTTNSHATADDWIKEGNEFIDKGSNSASVINISNVKDAIIPLGQALVAIATVVLVVITIIMGIKYMTCGSPEERAKLKTQLIGLVVSTIVIFGAQAIWALIYNFMINVTQ